MALYKILNLNQTKFRALLESIENNERKGSLSFLKRDFSFWKGGEKSVVKNNTDSSTTKNITATIFALIYSNAPFYLCEGK